jgi:hypothetical protein
LRPGFPALFAGDFLGGVAVFGDSGQACSFADADAASLDADPAAKVETSGALGNGEARWSPGDWPVGFCSPARAVAGLISADRSA